MEALAADTLFLGLDSSTQSLKATAVDTRLRVVAKETVNFDAELPHYKTNGGAHFGAPGSGRVTAPTRMWVEAWDKLLLKLKTSSFPFERVKAVSGSGQQHGTVYWKRGARARLRALEASRPLLAQLGDQFSVPDSPIWMDSSTGPQCRAMEAALGGAAALAGLTGSRAFERFSGPQIRKLAEDAPAAYRDTERVSLVSSFGASLLLGDYAAIDEGDGAGMNLMDLRARSWAEAALQACAPDLQHKLGPLVPSHAVLGSIHRYHVERFGFNPDCAVVAWSGDNLCSLAGLALQERGDVAISLGTSDTVFAVVGDPTPGLEGNVFPNPVDPSSYMAMLVYKNGSLTRQAVRDRCCGGSWEEFDRLLNAAPPLNNGCVGFYYDQPEILPPLPAGTHRFVLKHKEGEGEGTCGLPPAEAAVPVVSFDAPTEVRALVEGQLVAMRGHAERIGLQSPPHRVIATGGASANAGIVQLMGQIFGCPIYAAATTDSASLGAALRAAHGSICSLTGSFVPYSSVLRHVGSEPPDSSVHQSEAAPPGSEATWERYGAFSRTRLQVEARLLAKQREHAAGSRC